MTTIDVVLKNEFTLEAQKVRLAMQRVKQEVKSKSPFGKKELEALERTASNIGREVMSGVRAVGITAGFTSGSIVAVIAQVFNALDGFASAAVSQHSVAREVGVTYEEFERFVIAAKATGKTDEEARAGVERMFRAIRDLSLGTRSATRQKLEEGPGGADLARRFQQKLAESGLSETAKEIFQRMAKSAESGGPNGRWAAQLMAEALELDGEGWNHLAAMLEKVGRVAVPNEEAARKFLLAQRKNSIAWSRVRNMVSAALLPAFSRLLEVVSKIFNEENNQAFIKFINELIDGLLALDWESIRATIDDVLGWVGNEIVLFSEDLAKFVEDIDKFIQMVDRWRSSMLGTDMSQPKAVPYAQPSFNMGTSGLFTPRELTVKDAFTGNLPGEQIKLSADIEAMLAPRGSGAFQKWLETAPLSTNIIDLRGAVDRLPEEYAEIGARNIEDRRGEDLVAQSANRLTDQTEDLAFEMRRLVDVLRDIREGEGGGSSDGGVSRKARTRPMKTKAGGGGGGGGKFGGGGATGSWPQDETPQQRAMREDQAAADPKKAVAPVTTPAPTERRTVKSSWYGNYSPELGSNVPGGWVDKGDMDKQGKPKPGYAGYTLNVPGVAIPYLASVGPAGGQAGSIIRVWRPDGKGSDLVRQVDIGPNQVNPHSKDKGIDINAPLAERWGYVGTAKQARETGRPVFPTGQEITYEVMTSEKLLRARTEVQREAAKRGEGPAIPWKRAGRGATLDMDVNVSGPPGVEVNASLDAKGDFTPGDQGVKVNRTIANRFGDWD